jgi:hypothetical protein
MDVVPLRHAAELWLFASLIGRYHALFVHGLNLTADVETS